MTLSNGPNLGTLVNGTEGEEHYSQLMAQWRALDALVQPRVLSLILVAPPASPNDGDTYVIPTGATGAWVSHVGEIARWSGVLEAWEYYVPRTGWAVRDTTGTPWAYTGSGWIPSPPGVHTHPVSEISDSTTVGRALVTIPNPSAVRFIRVNADNTVSALSGADLRSAISALEASATAADSSKLGGLPVSASGARWNCVPTISTGGVMEVGQHLDFHESSGDTGDYGGRLSVVSGVFGFTGALNTTGGLTFNGSDLQLVYATSAVRYSYRMNGNAASPTKVLNGDYIGFYSYGGQYDTTPAHRVAGAQIAALATGDYNSTTDHPTDLLLLTSGASGGVLEAMRLTSTRQAKFASAEDCTGAGTGTIQSSGGFYCTKTSWIAGMLSIQGGAQLKRTTVSNADSTGAATDVLVVQTGTMSSARTHTLPAASSLKTGQVVWFADESGSVGSTNTWTIQRAGADTIEGGTSIVLNSAYARIGLMCDGTSKFTRITA